MWMLRGERGGGGIQLKSLIYDSAYYCIYIYIVKEDVMGEEKVSKNVAVN